MEDREYQIYKDYQDIIAPLIMELETIDFQFPVELLNEIRAIFTHLARYKTENNGTEIISAERHVKRAILDCFKHLCVSYATEIKKFRDEYRHVDLTLADNGRFLSSLNELETKAKNSYLTAKRAEIKMNVPDSEIYKLFETAYNNYVQSFDFIQKSSDAILFASNHSKRTNTITWISIAVTVISVVVAVISFIR